MMGFWKKAFRYALEFVIAGFGGWVYEVATMRIMYHIWEDRGMLHLPIIPIYSVGAFILLALLREKKRSPLFVFAFSTVVTTVFELASSYVLEWIFHRQFWSYEDYYLSILDRSCVITSAIFGVFALIYFYGIHPLSKKLAEKLPEPFCIAGTAVIVAVILGDLVVSVTELI